jgi:ribonuclease E
MSDTPEISPEKPKKKIITVGEDRLTKSDSGGDHRGGEGRGGKNRGGKNRGGKNRGGKGRGRDEGDRKPAVPPALMRGPKPKPKAVEEEVPEEVSPDVAEDVATEGVESADSTPSVSEAEAEASLA